MISQLLLLGATLMIILELYFIELFIRYFSSFFIFSDNFLFFLSQWAIKIIVLVITIYGEKCLITACSLWMSVLDPVMHEASRTRGNGLKLC